MRNPLSSLSRKQLGISGGAAAVIVVGLVLGFTLSQGSPQAAEKPPATMTTTPAPVTTTTIPLASNLCPLTGLPAPHGKPPSRPALAVKVGNEPEGARARKAD
jgi:hypothetical protein